MKLPNNLQASVIGSLSLLGTVISLLREDFKLILLGLLVINLVWIGWVLFSKKEYDVGTERKEIIQKPRFSNAHKLFASGFVLAFSLVVGFLFGGHLLFPNPPRILVADYEFQKDWKVPISGILADGIEPEINHLEQWEVFRTGKTFVSSNQAIDGAGEQDIIVWGRINAKVSDSLNLTTYIEVLDRRTKLLVDSLKSVNRKSNLILPNKDELHLEFEQRLSANVNCTILMIVGVILYNAQEWDNSITTFLRAIDLCGQEGGELNVAKAHHFIANSYLVIGDQDSAQTYFKKSLETTNTESEPNDLIFNKASNVFTSRKAPSHIHESMDFTPLLEVFSDTNNKRKEDSARYKATKRIFPFRRKIPLDRYALNLFREKWGLMSINGDTILTPIYDEVKVLSDNIAVACAENSCVLFDSTGSSILGDSIENWSQFSNGLAGIQKDYQWGFINKSGNIVIDFQYDEVYPFINGVALVKMKKKWEVINKNNEPITPSGHCFSVSPPYRTSEFIVICNCKSKKWGMISSAGEVVIPFEYKYISYRGNGIAKVMNDKNEEFLYHSRAGKTLGPLGYIGSFQDGMLRFKLDGKFGFIDELGKVRVPPMYDFAEDYVDGRSFVGLAKKKFYIDTNNNCIEGCE